MSDPQSTRVQSARVSEIYSSVQGESTYAGRPCIFVRFTGCPLRCVWCDTTYAFSGGDRLPLSEIVEQALAFGIDMVELTGGEPLAQPAALPLLTLLCDSFEQRFGTESRVLLETSGAFPIDEIDPRVRIILDVKAPGSGEVDRNHRDNWSRLRPHDEVKFVIADRTDYEWSRSVVHEQEFPTVIHFSPVHGELDPKQLVEWILEDRLPVRLQLQQHKYIWHPDEKGV